MNTFIRGISRLAVAGGAILVLGVAPVAAQYQPQGAAGAPPTAGLQAVSSGPTNYGGYVPPPPYGYGYGYGYPGYSPAGSYLNGVANLTNAAGEFQNQEQQARITQTQADSARLDLRRKLAEQEAWERARTPTVESIRLYEMEANLRRMKNNPPTQYIWSGEALNVLMDDVQKLQRTNPNPPSVPVSESILKQISVSNGTVSGEMSMFAGGKIYWPFAMTRPEFDKDRKKMEENAQKLTEQAKSGRLDFTTVSEMLATVKSLKEDMAKVPSASLSPSDTIAMKKFINQLALAVDGLKDPNAANYLNGTWVAKGSTVGEVVENMTSQGLKFAPGVDGSEAAYRAFYNSMLNYDLGLSRLAGR